MNAFTKIKLSRDSLERMPLEIQHFISEHFTFFSIETDHFPSEGTKEDYLFYDTDRDRLKFKSIELGELWFDFDEELRYHRSQRYSLKQEPLAKSLGLTQTLNRLVWDTTCGTGKDALLIAHFGARVVAFERHPLIYLLLLDAQRNSQMLSTMEPHSLQFVFGDSNQSHSETLMKPDTIYYDPMYPEKKKKSALPRKEMQIFKTVVGPDEDSDLFLHWAKTMALDRVVVKRSLQAPKIHPDVNAIYEGKSTRYDMYKILNK